MSGGVPLNLEVAAVGAVTPVGASARQSLASLRAGVSLFSENPFYWPTAPDPEWGDQEPVVQSAVPYFDPTFDGADRFVALAQAALLDLLPGAGVLRRDLARTGLLIGLPEADSATVRYDLARAMKSDLLVRAGLTDLAFVETEDSGHASALSLLPVADELLAAGRVGQVIVLAADSLVPLSRLAALDRQWRIRSERNVDGYIPGEAAAALLLRKAGTGPSLAKLVRFGTAEETNLRAGDGESTGAGLCGAILGALGNEAEGPDWVVCDMNGETYRAFEWGLALTRLGERLAGLREVSRPVECVGEIGAAIGPLLLAAAATALSRGYAPGGRVLVWAAAEAGRRVAVRMER